MCLQDAKQQQRQGAAEEQAGADLTAALVQPATEQPANAAAAPERPISDPSPQVQQQAGAILQAPVQQALPQRQQQHQAGEGQGGAMRQTLQRPALPALRLLGVHSGAGGQGEGVTARQLGSVSTAAAERGSEDECPSPSGSAHTPDAASAIDYSGGVPHTAGQAVSTAVVWLVLRLLAWTAGVLTRPPSPPHSGAPADPFSFPGPRPLKCHPHPTRHLSLAAGPLSRAALTARHAARPCLMPAPLVC